MRQGKPLYVGKTRMELRSQHVAASGGDKLGLSEASEVASSLVTRPARVAFGFGSRRLTLARDRRTRLVCLCLPFVPALP